MQSLRVEQIPHPDSHSRHLIFVGGANPAARGPDRATAPHLFAHRIQQLVPWKNDMGVARYQKLRIISQETSGLEGFDLPHQDERIDHHSVSNYAGLPVMKNSRGDEMENRLLTTDHQRMPGVVSALEPDHDLRVLRQQIDDFAFPLIAPLRSDHHDIWHGRVIPQRLWSDTGTDTRNGSPRTVAVRGPATRI